MCWCDRCGDVDLVCDDVQGECSRHHCRSCRQLLGRDDFNGDDWSATCATCLLYALNDDQRHKFERALERGDEDACRALAADLACNPTPSSAADLLWSLYRPIGGLLWGGIR